MKSGNIRSHPSWPFLTWNASSHENPGPHQRRQGATFFASLPLGGNVFGILLPRSLLSVPHLAARWHPSAPGRASSSLGSDLRATRLEERLTAPESLAADSQKTEGQIVPLGSTIKATTLEGVR